MVLLLQLLVPCFVLVGAGAISFYLPADKKKCLKEEIHKDVLVTGEYDVAEQPGIVTHLKVIDSIGHILYSREDAKKGKFAFTTEDYEVYEVCFESVSSSGSVRSPEQLIVLDIKHGVEAKNYENLAKAEKLKPLEVSLRRLEDLSQSIIKDFSYMKKREEEMSDTNESTSQRVLYFSMFSMFCLVALATWQVFYLRKFFKSKKLIE
ncbi:PREDICTED: transmembrane emp24 domain-containing protein 10-like [Nanorana parkeri]|uniref:transmembrane emp24 domain-containing protein 10-like n=1 Tax=Nanorana parkeri TaxID=125878 RepID=UPI000854C51A|nr:PREDICTED: transmembrane emp24 domain-containing protein 10-like [Nanorana parkeri]